MFEKYKFRGAIVATPKPRWFYRWYVLLERLVAAIEHIQLNGIENRPMDMEARLAGAHHDGWRRGYRDGFQVGYKSGIANGTFEPATTGYREGSIS